MKILETLRALIKNLFVEPLDADLNTIESEIQNSPNKLKDNDNIVKTLDIIFKI